ncbi:F-box domain, Phloem protein 2-like protein [Artemisia annua]|uniref:F-box domain, Phloem protein 2-like protein n=1 Tax=Artemisia annua TaxID=35608 RepID=A0A2U1L5Q6_ARTAN|nr:F-box domain, Phloem protein 2-like protein [Artemisia annua]
MEHLPEDCITHILSFGSPRDACRSMVLASIFKNAAESEVLWDKFLPPDYQEIVSKSVCPIVYKSKKELFFKLCSPLLIDGGLKTFSIDMVTGKKCYMLSARHLYIAWSSNPLFWCWKRVIQSRFAKGVELIMASWLEVQGKISTHILSSNTIYRAYLIVQVAHHRAYGLDVLPFEVLIELGNFRSRGTVLLFHKHSLEHVKVDLRSSYHQEVVSRVCRERNDGWLEIELGEFYNDGSSEKEVKMSLREVDGVHLKGGLLVEGIEIRPVS